MTPPLSNTTTCLARREYAQCSQDLQRSIIEKLIKNIRQNRFQHLTINTPFEICHRSGHFAATIRESSTCLWDLFIGKKLWECRTEAVIPIEIKQIIDKVDVQTDQTGLVIRIYEKTAILPKLIHIFFEEKIIGSISLENNFPFLKVNNGQIIGLKGNRRPEGTCTNLLFNVWDRNGTLINEVSLGNFTITFYSHDKFINDKYFICYSRELSFFVYYFDTHTFRIFDLITTVGDVTSFDVDNDNLVVSFTKERRENLYREESKILLFNLSTGEERLTYCCKKILGVIEEIKLIKNTVFIIKRTDREELKLYSIVDWKSINYYFALNIPKRFWSAQDYSLSFIDPYLVVVYKVKACFYKAIIDSRTNTFFEILSNEGTNTFVDGITFDSNQPNNQLVILNYYFSK